MNKKQLQINNYNELRRIYCNVSILLTSGILSLFFIEISIIKFLILFIIGIFFDFIFIIQYFETNRIIKKLINKGD